jgi:hypothetical protein
MYVPEREMEGFFSLRLRSKTVVRRWSPRREWEDGPSWWGSGRWIRRKWSTRTFDAGELQRVMAWMQNGYAYTPTWRDNGTGCYEDAVAVRLSTAGLISTYLAPPTFAVQRYTLDEDEPDEICAVWMFDEPRAKPRTKSLSEMLARRLDGAATTCIPVAGVIGHVPGERSEDTYRDYHYRLVEVGGPTYDPDSLLTFARSS